MPDDKQAWLLGESRPGTRFAQCCKWRFVKGARALLGEAPGGTSYRCFAESLDVGRRETVQSLILKSMAMLDVVRRIGRAAQVDSPVFIWGEKGVGKKLVAETIHCWSRRRPGPLVTVSTESMTDPQLDEKLFGTSTQSGALTAANGGSLLVDGITGLSRRAQAKLLHAAEDGYFGRRSIGAGQAPNFRLMATSPRKLSESVERGTVREDLYYWLSVVNIHVPPLRERKEDIPLLVQQVLGELCAARAKAVPDVEPELMRYLAERPWPGNAWELRECLEAMLETEETSSLGVRHLFPSRAQIEGGPANQCGPGDTLAEVERTAITRALEAHHGNRTEAAKSLGISVRTVQRKLRQWGI
jgi:DNA-binding NtrC family response regulator